MLLEVGMQIGTCHQFVVSYKRKEAKPCLTSMGLVIIVDLLLLLCC
jgi:hypothetical protein